MIALALDTSTRRGSIAIAREGVVLAERRLTCDRAVAERLPGAILDELTQLGLPLSAVDVFAVVSGPGGFTGLRVGLATMQALALVLDRPVLSLTTLDLLARIGAETDGLASEAAISGAMVVALDGQRQDVFVSLHELDGKAPLGVRTLAGPAAMPLDRWLETSVGDVALARGVLLESDHWPPDEVRALLRARGAAVVTIDWPLAPTLARLASLPAMKAGWRRPHALQPTYVRRPDVELARDRDGGAQETGS